MPANQNLIAIEGTATYERILSVVRDVEIDEAIHHIQDFLKIYPEFSQAHNDIAVLYYRDGNPLRALAHHEKAHKLDPGNIVYRKNLADFYFTELEWAGDAIQIYLDILKNNPFDVEALNTLGTISLRIGRKEQARQYFTRTLQLDDNNKEARQALDQMGASQAAQPDTRRISGEAPPACQGVPAVVPVPASQPIAASLPETRPEPARSPDELYNEAINLVDTDRPDEALQLLETLVAQDPGNALAHNDLGVLYQKCNDLQRSLRNHEEAVRLKPSSAVFQKNLADLLCVGFGKFEEALRIYVSLQAKAPQDIGILKAIAYVCWRVEMPDKARFFLERVLALQPWDHEAQEALTQLESDNTRKELR
ncbi:MAG: tetratricopeptide repeat protein [Oryzomonas sp.]|uniref:tetratricopeptide repeat protein n=1 Tax=Oryzomonas sp. TaxID=2855186 RepID=UPI00283BCC84|nr:tetratricopeptide repeat protein [Oryzomonas sp.]MDR3579546.1 tetratricopeptide repeat protein [Oryzomonas sp.]